MNTPVAVQVFLDRAVARLRRDPRIDAVLLCGSAIEGKTDRFSDVDLTLVCRPADYPAILAERPAVAASLGELLASFTGEHVGEPRLLICLFDAPLLHVDLKFVTPDALAQRVETPLVLFAREPAQVAAALAAGVAEWPSRTPEWFEARFWIWIHYGAGKIARGELFEAHDLLALVRSQVLGPMLARNEGRRQRGLRHVETVAPAHVEELARTLPRHDRADCWRALQSTIALYLACRRDSPPAGPDPRAERAVRNYIAEQQAAGDGS